MIPNEILDYELCEIYTETGPDESWTIRKAIDATLEQVEHFEMEDSNPLSLRVWTKTWVGQVIYDGLGGYRILWLPRNFI